MFHLRKKNMRISRTIEDTDSVKWDSSRQVNKKKSIFENLLYKKIFK